MRQEEPSGVATHEGDVSLCLQGVNHLALNTDNMRTTLEFYTRVLGMRLVHAGRALEPVDLSGQPLDRSASGQPPHADVRHYMLDMGGGSLLAFFEYPPGTPRGDCNRVATMQHVSFTVSQQHFALAQRRCPANEPNNTPKEALGALRGHELYVVSRSIVSSCAGS